MLDHLSIQCADVQAAASFYDAVLTPLGGSRIMDFGEVIGYGVASKPDFWLGPQNTGAGFREAHIAFAAADNAAVDAFWAAGTEAGYRDNGVPGERAAYHPGYYAAYLLDPDGNNIEAICHNR